MNVMAAATSTRNKMELLLRRTEAVAPRSIRFDSIYTAARTVPSHNVTAMQKASNDSANALYLGAFDHKVQ